MYKTISFANKYTFIYLFIYSFLICIHFPPFSYLVAEAKTSDRLFNERRETEHPYLVPHFSRSGLISFLFNAILAMGFAIVLVSFYVSLIRCRVILEVVTSIVKMLLPD